MKLVSGRIFTALIFLITSTIATAQNFVAGEPIGSVNEDGVRMAMSDNVKVYGSFHFSESCTFDPDKNLILAKYLTVEAHKNPDFYQAFHYMRRGDEQQVNSMEWLLANWLENCPERLQFAPKKIAELLGHG